MAKCVRTNRIRNEIEFPVFLIPKNVESLINKMDSGNNREVTRIAKTEIEVGEFSEGLIIAVKKAIQTINKVDSTNTNSDEARFDRILNVEDSNGNKSARKW